MNHMVNNFLYQDEVKNMSDPTGSALLARIKQLEDALRCIKPLAQTAILDASMYELTAIQIRQIMKEVDKVLSGNHNS